MKAYLWQHRLSARPLPDDGSTDQWNGAVSVFVGRHIVTPPDCPNWGKPAGIDSANRTASNLGCATTRNLGLMLADPGDLVRTNPLAPADGEAAATSIQRYRAGKVNDASASINTVGSSGSGK